MKIDTKLHLFVMASSRASHWRLFWWRGVVTAPTCMCELNTTGHCSQYYTLSLQIPIKRKKILLPPEWYRENQCCWLVLWFSLSSFFSSRIIPTWDGSPSPHVSQAPHYLPLGPDKLQKDLAVLKGWLNGLPSGRMLSRCSLCTV